MEHRCGYNSIDAPLMLLDSVAQLF